METISFFTRRRIILRRHVVDFYYFGFIVFIILSQYNTALWGASFSFALVPAFLFLLGALTSQPTVRKESLLILPIFFLYLFSTGFSSYVEIGRDFLSFAVFCLFFILTVSHYYRKNELKKLILIYIIISLTVSLNICYQWINHVYLQAWLKRSTFVFFGVFKDPNYAMALIAPAAVFSAFLFINSKKFIVKLICFLNIAFAFLACICASTRAGMLAIALPIALIPLFASKMSIWKRLAFLVLLVFIILVGYWIITATYNEYALARFFHDDTGSGRLDIWESALLVFKDRPIFGGGLNSGSAVSVVFEAHTTHSVFIDILCDSGIVGLLLFAVFFVKNCLCVSRRNLSFQLIMAFSFLIPLFFINGFNTITFYFPIIVLSIMSNYNKDGNYLDIVRFI